MDLRSGKLELYFGPCRDCGRMRFKREVMPPGWQIAPDKRASTDRQSLARCRLFRTDRPLPAPNFYGAVSTAPMTQLPLVLVPTYLVPTFLILHLTELFQARRLST